MSNVSELGDRLGQRIRELRQLHPENFNQEDLAQRARISVSFLSMIERGERVPHVETLVSLSDALGITLADLFAGTEDRPADSLELMRPLADFFRLRRLGSREVDKLLRVARAIFQ